MVARPQEQVRFEARPHGVVLAPAFARALILVGCGLGLMAVGWHWTPPGALLVVVGALTALRAVWTWERTRLIVTTERLIVRHGTFRQRRVEVPLARARAIEIDQGLLGRMLGYATLVAGELEVQYVADPRTVCRLATGSRA